MAQAQTFADILDKPSSEIERPKPLPAGSYTCMVQGQPRYDKSSKKQTPFVEFTLKVMAPGEDVDPEELTAMGGIEGKTIRATYYLTEDAAYRLKEFLNDCGIEEDDEVSLRQRIEQTPNCSVIAVMRHEASADGQQIYAQLAKTQPAE